MKISSPIYQLKRRAKLQSRGKKLKLNEALDQIAFEEGFQSWSHLAHTYSKATPAKTVLRQMKSGDMVIIAARPGQGKTLLGLELAALAAGIGRAAYVFTLEYSEKAVWDQLRQLGLTAAEQISTITVDTSDDICASYIANRVADGAEKSVVVIDYLQVLDQKRSSPPLKEQVRELRKFATETGSILIITSQIDRSFDATVNCLPSIDDIRLPNHADLSSFDMRCFLQDGEIHIDTPV